MSRDRCSSVLWLVLAGATGVRGQVVYNSQPSRTLGQPQALLTSTAPNLVEGRELNLPQGVAVDTTLTPPALYVADTGNNRVLGWRDATRFRNGAAADLVLGQPDRFTTFPQGPGRTGSILSAGFNAPTAVIADANGSLYVADAGNNRVLRFPKPFSAADRFPDLIIGQNSINTTGTNPEVNERTLSISAPGGSAFRTAFAFDAQGNLFFTDAGNNRVLRYSAADLKPGSPNQPAADILFGQTDFSTNAPLALSGDNRFNRSQMNAPAGIALDAAGRLYVSDLLARVLVYEPPLFSGRTAARILGIQAVPSVSDTTILSAEGLFMSGPNPGLLDSGLHRILIFDPAERWAPESTLFSPPARSVFGQADFSGLRPNRGQPEAGADTLRSPVAAAVLGNELFVVDAGNSRVLVLPRPSPTQLLPAARVLGQDDFTSGGVNLLEGREFSLADRGGLLVDTRANPPRVYVSDTANHRVLGFRDFRAIKTGAKADLVIGQRNFSSQVVNYPSNDPDKPNDQGLFLPAGLALDDEGNLYVADSGNGRVLRFPLPFDYTGPAPQKADLVLGQVNFTFKINDPNSRTMASPFGLAFAGESGLLVSDASFHRVLLFAGRPKDFVNNMVASKVYGQSDFVSTRAGGPETDNRMNSPRHLATDADGRLYVADAGNNRVMIFDQVASTPASGARTVIQLTNIVQGARLAAPRSVYVHPDTGEIWVTDTANSRLVRYPKFDDLPLNFQANGAVLDESNGFGFLPLAVVQDQAGAVIFLDSANRLAVHFPAIVPLNAANSLPFRALAPGLIVSMYPRGSKFSEDTETFSSTPLPRELADTEVRVNGEAAPLYYVSPDQINFMVPTSAPVSGTVDAEVIRKSTGLVVAAGPLPMDRASPGLFSVSGTGGGQVAALNQDNTPNSEEKPAARGEIIQLFGTGQGVIPGGPPDGAPATGQVPTDVKPRVIVNTAFVADSDVVYSGLAPGLVGVWQINVKIPDTVPPSPSIVVAIVHRGIASIVPGLRTTIAVKE